MLTSILALNVLDRHTTLGQQSLKIWLEDAFKATVGFLFFVNAATYCTRKTAAHWGIWPTPIGVAHGCFELTDAVFLPKKRELQCFLFLLKRDTALAFGVV
jgi:hypothetical protein